MPVNYRIYDQEESKTKNDYFREMVLEVISWGLKPKIVTGDSWYSGVENLKFLKNQELGFFYRAIKQVCGVCRLMVRDSQAIKTHVFCSLQAFVRLEKMRAEKTIANWYEVQKNLFTSVIREYIVNNLAST